MRSTTPILVLAAALVLSACRMEETVQEPEHIAAAPNTTAETPAAEATSAAATATLRTATFAVG